jgi:XTP/dITP diphosphohydrolase
VSVQIYVSTQNRDKLREISELLGPNVGLLHPSTDDPDVEETGDSLWDNALLKARVGHDRSGLPTIADDTGLEVDALNGAPGIYSARYAGENARYEDNRRKLIEEITQVPEESRSARFRTVVAYVDKERELRFDGVVEGRILTEERGSGGFGYDPVFLVENSGKTMAEMSAEEKNGISHRGRALQAFLKWWINSNKD